MPWSSRFAPALSLELDNTSSKSGAREKWKPL